MPKPPTMDDVAREARVSRALVSLVMSNSDKVGDARRAAVLEAASRLGYRPNVLARNLARNRTRTIGVMINDLRNPYFVDVLDGIQEASESHGYRLLLNTGRRDPGSEKSAVETLLEYRVDGLVLAGPRLTASAITSAATSAPVVILGRSIRSRSVDSINNDEAIGAKLVVDHLAGLGHCRIAHFHGGSGAGAPARRAGYEAAMRARGLDEHIRVVAGDFTAETGAAAALTALGWPTLPTAVFATNDLMAAGALDTFEEAGMSVPGDISIVGYDNTGLAAMPHMSLSTVHQPREEMGRLAIDALIERMECGRTDVRREVLAPQLVARSTSGPVRDR